MRNDARPFGDDQRDSPTGLPARPSGEESEQPDARDSVTHDRQSHIINPAAESTQPDAPDDPVTPISDSSRRTRI